MFREEKIDQKALTYTYHVASLDKKEMLGYLVDILEDDDITSHGVIVTNPNKETDWDGLPIEIPVLPERETFLQQYSTLDFTGMTAIMEYHGMTIMLSYRPKKKTIAVIIPVESEVSIEEIEKNVIPDAIDHNPAE